MFQAAGILSLGLLLVGTFVPSASAAALLRRDNGNSIQITNLCNKPWTIGPDPHRNYHTIKPQKSFTIAQSEYEGVGQLTYQDTARIPILLTWNGDGTAYVQSSHKVADNLQVDKDHSVNVITSYQDDTYEAPPGSSNPNGFANLTRFTTESYISVGATGNTMGVASTNFPVEIKCY